jgi:hypothetical protein
LGLFEFIIAVVIIVAAPIVFWFFYSIIALRLGWEPRNHDYLPDRSEEGSLRLCRATPQPTPA